MTRDQQEHLRLIEEVGSRLEQLILDIDEAGAADFTNWPVAVARGKVQAAVYYARTAFTETAYGK